METEQIEVIKDMLKKAYPWESSVTGYKFGSLRFFWC